jgi:hypothetical protein
MTRVEPRLPVQIVFGAALGTLTFLYLLGRDRGFAAALVARAIVAGRRS